MKLTVCEMHNEAELFERDWKALVAHVQHESSDLVLLPELPFYRWFGVTESVDPQEWQKAVEAHDRWLPRLNELAPAVVLGSRPAERGGKRLNEGFVWTQDGGYQPAHHKYYLPDEPGFWEATWYSRGDGIFAPAAAGQACIGFMICSELWFFEHARAYGKQGAEIIVTPRCTGTSVEKWLVGGRAAAVVSGAYSLSSNRVGFEGAVEFGGQGWIVDPNGVVLGITSQGQPFLSLDLDLEQAKQAKQTYPRYIGE